MCWYSRFKLHEGNEVDIVKDQLMNLLHKKYVAVIALLGVVLICAVAVYNGNRNQQTQNPYMVMKENESASAAEQTEQIKQTQQMQADASVSDESLAVDVQKSTNDELAAQDNTQELQQAGADIDQTTSESVEETTISEQERQAAQTAALIEAAGLAFSADTKMTWPVHGQVIKEFSMDQTTYFPTLNEYKCNPAMLIQGEAGTQVIVPAKAIVTAVGENEEIGRYVELALSNDYQMILGQLTAIQVEKGDTVEAGAVIANIADSTSYYELEGSHLYMELQHDGVSVDPLDYLE